MMFVKPTVIANKEIKGVSNKRESIRDFLNTVWWKLKKWKQIVSLISLLGKSYTFWKQEFLLLPTK